MSKQTHYNVDIIVAEGLLAQTDAMKKPENCQAVAMVSIAQSLIAISKILKEKRLTQSEPQQLGRNDSSKGGGNPHPYRETPNLQDSELFPGMQSVKEEEHGFFGTRTGRNERRKPE